MSDRQERQERELHEKYRSKSLYNSSTDWTTQLHQEAERSRNRTSDVARSVRAATERLLAVHHILNIATKLTFQQNHALQAWVRVSIHICIYPPVSNADRNHNQLYVKLSMYLSIYLASQRDCPPSKHAVGSSTVGSPVSANPEWSNVADQIICGRKLNALTNG
jgi:hypothetical protein